MKAVELLKNYVINSLAVNISLQNQSYRNFEWLGGDKPIYAAICGETVVKFCQEFEDIDVSVPTNWRFKKQIDEEIPYDLRINITKDIHTKPFAMNGAERYFTAML